ncbi:MAG TPA: cytochrome C [Burkholderiales bacterium]|nr:cytochrome C [Burkholderiales bacterium]
MLLVCLVFPAAAATQPKGVVSRGELLYTTHCIACHNTRIHWRDNKAAKDWSGLSAQVRRWQDVGDLGWSDGDIVQVARYLNALYYHYPEHVQ